MSAAPSRTVSATPINQTIQPITPNTEDDGSILRARDTGIGPSRYGISTSGRIGDGPYGGYPRSGDFDFYKVNLQADETMVAQTSTTLDTTISVYDSDGWEVDYDDDGGPGTRDSRVEFTAWDAGSYYVAVTGYSTYQDDPFDSSSGDGAASEGSYNLTITAS